MLRCCKAAALLASLVCASGAAGQPEPEEETMARTPAPPWSASYHDGSGNGYRLWQEAGGGAARVEYIPVRPETSSSGFYSGGAPWTAELDTAQVAQLWTWLRRLESDRELHVTQRAKGTGAVSWKTAEDERDFLVGDRDVLAPFEQFLKVLKPH